MNEQNIKDINELFEQYGTETNFKKINTDTLRKLTEQIKEIHEQREFNRQLLKQYEIAPEYIPYMLRERQEKLNNNLQTLWMIRKEFE